MIEMRVGVLCVSQVKETGLQSVWYGGSGLVVVAGHPDFELPGRLADISSITGSGDSASRLGA